MANDKSNNQKQVDYDYQLNGINESSFPIFSTIYAVATWLRLKPVFNNIKWLPTWLKSYICIILSVITIFLAFEVIFLIWEFFHKLKF